MNLTYNDPCCEPKVSERCGPVSMKERLENQKVELEERLVRVNAALTALNEHPEVMKVLELVSKV